MANLAVNIVMLVKLKDGKYRYRPAVTTKNGRVRLGYALVDGEPEHHPKARYYLQYRDEGLLKYDALRPEIDAMLVARMNKELELQARAKGLVVLGPPPTPEPTRVAPRTKKASVSTTADSGAARSVDATAPAGTSITTAVEVYLEEIRVRRRKKTYQAYRSALLPFWRFVGKRGRIYLEQITREDILAFMDWLHEEEGNGQRTIRKQFDTIKRIFRREKIAWPMLPEDAPRYTKKRVTVYKESELEQLFEAATVEEYEIFQFFLFTGGREQDVMYTSWHDIDFEDGLFLIVEKDIQGAQEVLELAKQHKRGDVWGPKDREEAGVPIPDSLIEILKQRRARYPGSRWVFPAPTGEPDGHFLRKLKNLAFRAGLNCGTCVATLNGKPACCDQHPVCHRWTLHKFRRTFATMHHRQGVDVRTIQHWLRHSDLETTLRYLAAIEYTDRETRKKVNATAERLGKARQRFAQAS
jgi:integrase/recombinase XerD